MSLPLGFLLAANYKIFGDYNWYGILITFSNLVFLLATVYILNSYTKTYKVQNDVFVAIS
jgi:hypothetical protein